MQNFVRTFLLALLAVNIVVCFENKIEEIVMSDQITDQIVPEGYQVMKASITKLKKILVESNLKGKAEFKTSENFKKFTPILCANKLILPKENDKQLQCIIKTDIGILRVLLIHTKPGPAPMMGAQADGKPCKEVLGPQLPGEWILIDHKLSQN